MSLVSAAVTPAMVMIVLAMTLQHVLGLVSQHQPMQITRQSRLESPSRLAIETLGKSIGSLPSYDVSDFFETAALV